MIKRQTLLKILVCDDDPQDRKLIRTHLQQITDREIVILEAGQTDEIQTALDKGRIDLVFMDIRMPAKSGIEWLTEIVEKHLAPVVMLTGYGLTILSLNGQFPCQLPLKFCRQAARG